MPALALVWLLPLVLGCPGNPGTDGGGDLSAGDLFQQDLAARGDLFAPDLPGPDLWSPDLSSSADGAAPGPDPGKPGPRRTVGFDLSIPLGTLPASGTLSTTVVGPSDDGATISLTGAPFPLVVLSPGFTLPRAQFRAYADRLASFGFVAVLQKARAEANHTQYRDDTIAAIDWLLAPTGPNAGKLSGRVDGGRVGVAGHSLGGQISILVAAKDPRVKALFGIDPVDGGSPAALDAIVGIHLPGGLPIGMLGETTSKAGGTPCTPTGVNYEALYDKASSPAFAITLFGAAHNDFVDDYGSCLTCGFCLPTGTAPRMRTHDLAVKYLTAYFLLGLVGDAGARDYLLGGEFNHDVMAGLVTEKAK